MGFLRIAIMILSVMTLNVVAGMFFCTLLIDIVVASVMLLSFVLCCQ